MGKILLIEPYKILRQAISLSLFPEHEVHAEESFSASGTGSLKEYDLLIVDGSALREKNQLTSEVTRAIQHCKTPTLWLEEDDASRPFSREGLKVIRKPIERDAFQSTLEEFLSPQTSPSRGRDATTPAKSKATPSKRAGEEPGEGPEQTVFQFVDLVDLVDVVEEQPRSKQRKKTGLKSK